MQKQLIGTCGHVVEICPNGEGDAFACESFCGLCEGLGDYCPTCEGKPIPKLLQHRCTCEKPEASGWHVVDDAGITFGGLKQAQNEASRDAAQWIAHIYFTKSEKLFANLMHDITQGIELDTYWNGCEWETKTHEG